MEKEIPIKNRMNGIFIHASNLKNLHNGIANYLA